MLWRLTTTPSPNCESTKRRRQADCRTQKIRPDAFRTRSLCLSAYAEADKKFQERPRKLQREVVTLERVRELDEKIEASQIQSKHLKEELSTSKPPLASSLKKALRLKKCPLSTDHPLTASEQEDG